MKYRTQQYAQALFQALRDKSVKEQKEIMRRFVALLARHRVSGKTGLIIAAYESIVLRESGMRKVEIEAASPVADALKREITKIVGRKIDYHERINPDILAGVKILVDNEFLIDASGKRQLERIF